MTGDVFLRWFPVVTAGVTLLFLPVFVLAFNAQIDRRVEIHNANLYAHPALNDLKKLESEIKDLSRAIARLELAFARFVTKQSEQERSE